MTKLPILLLPFLLLPAAHGQKFTEINDLPEAKGKDVVQKVCSVCHEPTAVSKYRKSKDDWGAVIDDMVTKGADATDAEFDTIIGYLTRCFGPVVNVNKATADDLGKQLDLSATESAAIVQYRQSKGDFKELADLKNVDGLDYKKIEPVRYRITF